MPVGKDVSRGGDVFQRMGLPAPSSASPLMGQPQGFRELGKLLCALERAGIQVLFLG